MTDPPSSRGSQGFLPRTTIVTPSFNQAEFLEETIRSVLLQRYDNLEYFVVDGGSTDGSIAILEKYSPWLDWWVSEKDRGQADALNKGFARATGEIWAYLNSDDVFAPGILQEVATEYRAARDRERFWIGYPIEDFGACAPVVHLPPHEHDLGAWVRRAGNLCQPGSFWAAELGLRAGPFDNSYRFAFDRKLFMEFIRRGAHLQTRTGRVAARFRLHSNSKTVVEHEDWEENGFEIEFQRLSLEYARWLPKDEGRACARQARQLLMDRTHRRVGRCPTLGGRVKELFDLLALSPCCLGTRFFWGTARQAVLGR